MTDQFDRATDLEEKQREIALAFRNPTLTPCGACHNCSVPLNRGLLFCCKECAEDYEMREKMDRLKGKL